MQLSEYCDQNFALQACFCTFCPSCSLTHAHVSGIQCKPNAWQTESSFFSFFYINLDFFSDTLAPLRQLRSWCYRNKTILRQRRYLHMWWQPFFIGIRVRQSYRRRHATKSVGSVLVHTECSSVTTRTVAALIERSLTSLAHLTQVTKMRRQVCNPYSEQRH